MLPLIAGEQVTDRPGQKATGAYYTPDSIVRTLLRWAIRRPEDQLLDPACGDGRFIAGHCNSVGVEQDLEAAHTAMKRARWARVYENDFFSWASEAPDRFDCAAGNPPFIRYQTFKGDSRAAALALCKRLGAEFSALTSSWAPFLVATAGLLRRGGRMAFVVPAEIGHAPYSSPLLEYLISHFGVVHIIAVRERLFPELSEDCWLLYADEYGSTTNEIRLTVSNKFRESATPPRRFTRVGGAEWRQVWRRRLRPYLIDDGTRGLYREIAERRDTHRFGDVASIGIGYVSGANDFFHLRPSQVEEWGISYTFLHPTVRNGRALSPPILTNVMVDSWRRNDDPVLLLRLPKHGTIPNVIWRYLDTDEGQLVRHAYKCRMREPWYSVPDVQVPDFFLSYMSGVSPLLVQNDALCTCTNSIHGVRLKRPENAGLLSAWGSDFVQLSCELEGHPLGGGMLKLEPREASNIVLPDPQIIGSLQKSPIQEAVSVMRSWRHYASGA